MRILFAGGGTGGHLFPGFALAESLRQKCENLGVVFVGTAHGLDRDLVGRYDYRFVEISAGRGSPISLRAPLNAPRFLIALAQSWRLLARQPVEAVVALGGFAAAAPGLVAGWLGVPLILLEQNTVPGRVNRLLDRYACQVHLQFNEARSHLRRCRDVRHSGSPLRQEMRALVSLPPAEGDVLLVMGGSQGARRLNELMVEAVAALPKEGRPPVVHVAGATEEGAVRAAYEKAGVQADVLGFVDSMADLIRRAGLCVSRAGAMSCAELAVAGVPTVFVPLPSAADDHQRMNAASMAAGGGAKVLDQPSLTPAELAQAIHSLWRDVDERRRMGQALRSLARPDAGDEIADCVLQIMTSGVKGSPAMESAG